MTQWIAISRSDHAQSLYWPRDGYHFTSSEQVVPVLLAELGKLLPHFMLGFIKESDTYQLVAVTGLGQGNLYLHPEGKWLGSYVPAMLRGYPFRLVANQEGGQMVCIASDHLTDEPSAKPLFDDEGSLAAPVAQNVDFLQQCEQNRQVTAACVQKLSEADLLEAWPLQISRGEGQEPLTVNGLHRVSEQALNALDAETLHGLRGGPLSMAYAQMLSTHQLNQLTQRAELQGEIGANSALPESLDSLFENDDDLSFDFDS